MAYFVASSTGITIVAAENSLEETKYSPVYGEEMDVKFILDSLPDFYRNFMEGKEYLYSLWGGASQIITSDLLNLYQIDYSKSLRDIPTFTQRKWTRFELENEVDFSYDPSFSTSGVAGKFEYSSSNQNLSASFTQRSGGVDRYYKNLNGTLNEQSSLVWSADVSVTSADSISALLFGYLSQSSTDLSGSLLAGLVKFDSSIRVCVFHTPTKGVASVGRTGSTDLSTSTDYQIQAEYSSSESSVVVSVTEKRFQRLASTSGTTLADEDGGLTVRLLSDSLVDFVVSGVEVGDFVVFGGYSHEIVEVAQNSLTVKYNTLPASATSMGYTVVGPKLIDSVSLNLLNESSKTLSCNAFGLITPVPFDLRDVYTSLVSSVVYSAHTGKSMVCTVDNVSYSDPTFAETPIRIPKLQDSPLSPTSTKQQNVDYTVQSSQISFSLPTEGVWHSEFGLFDEEIVYDNFGANAGIAKAASSDEFVNRVRGLYYSLLSGPTVASIKTGVLASVGLPIAVEAGEVTAINPAYSGQKGLITINNSRNYLYPLAVGTDLSLGDSVDQFQPLSRGVDVYDYINNPTWFNDFPVIKEIQKYHTFLVNLDLDALDASVSDSEEVFSAAARHLQVVRPTHKNFVFVGSRSLSDVTGIDDSILLSLTLHVEDAITEPYPAYDDSRFFAPAYDWAYDQGQTEWEEIPSSVAYFAYQETETKPWNGTSSESKFLTGGTVEIVESQTFITDASGQYISELGRVCSESSTGGTIAGTTFTGNSLERFLTTIPNASGTLPTGMVIKVVVSDGSSAYAVHTATAIASDTELTLSGSPAAISGATYEVRVSGPVGTVYVQNLSGAGSTSGTTFTSTGSPAFETAVPHDGGSPKVPTKPTYVFVDPFQEDADDYLRQVTQVDSNTQLTVASAFAGALSSKNYIVFNPQTAVAASPGVASTAGTTTTNTFVATSSTAVITASSTGVVDAVGLEDSTGSNPFNTKANGNISAGFGLSVSGSGAGLDGNYAITGLFLDGDNYIKTDPAFGITGSVASYTVNRGAFQDVSAGDLFVVESGANTGIYTISGVSSSSPEKGRDTITISGSFPSAVATTGYVYKIADIWARVVHVDSDTKIYTATAWSGDGKDSTSDPGGGTGANTVSYAEEVEYAFLSEVDLKVLEVFYDQSDELSPDEDVQLLWTPTVGYGGELLHDASSHLIFTTDGSNKNEFNHTSSLTSTAPSANDVIILPNGRAREVSSYTAGPPGTITLVGTNSAQDDAGADFTSATLYLIPAASVAIAGTSFTFTNGSSSVAILGALSGSTLSAGDLIQPILPSGSGNNMTDLPVVEIDTVSASTITLTSNYTGDGIVTTKVVVRDTSSMATDLGSYFDLTGADFHNVEVPGSDQTMSYTIPENTFL